MKNRAFVSNMFFLLLSAAVSRGGTDPKAAKPEMAAPAPDVLRTELVALEKRSWEAWQKHDGKFFQENLQRPH